jgi:radical SAM superfamily enzyme YgiQ (UPF0313 family)
VKGPLFLVMPPQAGLLAGFATGLLSLRRYLALHLPGQRVEILDFSGLAEADIQWRLAGIEVPAEDPIFLGITTTTATYQSALALARHAKLYWGHRVQVVFGGPHASADAKVVLDRQAGIVDFVVCGEGEAALAALLTKWPDVAGTAGLAYRSQARVYVNPSPPLLSVAELDALTIDEEWFDLIGHPGKFDSFTYVSARGCPLSCAFCSVSNMAIRAKSAKVLVEEVASIVKRGYHRIAIEDNFFAHSPLRTEEVCNALERILPNLPKFDWDCQTRVESVARAGTAQRLEAAGCRAVYLGVEALAPLALQFLRKAANAQRYIDLLLDRALPALLATNLEIYLNFQFGLPPEAGDYLPETMDRLVEIGSQVNALERSVTIFPQLFVVYPGTAHSARFIAEGVLWPEAYEDFTAWERDENELLYWLGRYFAHGAGGIPLGLLDRDALKRREFKLDPRPLLAIERRLDGLAACAGVTVFSYSPHLAPAALGVLAQNEETINEALAREMGDHRPRLAKCRLRKACGANLETAADRGDRDAYEPSGTGFSPRRRGRGTRQQRASSGTRLSARRA